MGKPNYRVLVAFDSQRAVFSARAPELEHLSGDGPTRKEAIAKLEEEIEAQLANMLSSGETPPRAVDEEQFTGELQCKVSRALHRDLAFLARSEGVELDQIVSELLAAAYTLRQGPRHGRSRHPNQAVQELTAADDIGNRAELHRGGHADGNRADGNRRFGRGGGYSPQLFDDRANFIEYVRNQEQQGGGAIGRGGQGQHRHGGGINGGGDQNRRRRRGGGGGQGHQGGHPGQHAQHGQHGSQNRDGGNRMQGQGGRGPGGGQHGHQPRNGNAPRPPGQAAPPAQGAATASSGSESAD